jgi:endonuclease III
MVFKTSTPQRDFLKFVREHGKPYSEMLSIDLNKGDRSYFEWFLAAFLYSKPIREETATKTFKLFKRYGLADPESLLKVGWERIVDVLDEGGYTRYDFSTADRILDICGNLMKEYGGSLSRVHELASDSRDLEKRLRRLGKGVGPVTVSVFLRDMRKVWRKADPQPTPRVADAMRALNISDLEEFAKSLNVGRVELETALHRYSRKARSAKVKRVR